MNRHFQLNSTDIICRVDKLMDAASNRYRIVVQIAKRAKRCRYEDMDSPEIPMLKPVIRAVLELSDELMEPEILRDDIN